MMTSPLVPTDVDDLAARFSAGTISREEWTHLAHLAVGTWHVQRYGPDEALTRLRAGIRRLNDLHGTPNSAASIAGCKRSSHSRTPKRWWSSHHAATAPGTVTAWPPRFGT